MKVLHVIGSCQDEFFFNLSFMYGKSCPLDVLKDFTSSSDELIEHNVQYDYALFVPPFNTFETESNKLVDSISWFFIRGQKTDLNSANLETAVARIDENLFVPSAADPEFRAKYLPKIVQGPFKTGHFLHLIETEQENSGLYSLMVPHFFDYLSLTTIRSMFEDVLGIPAPGPSSTCYALSQHKGITRSVLSNVPGVNIPQGEVLYFKGSDLDDVDFDDSELPRVSVPLPIVVKPANEDNSRGLSLCRKEEEIIPALRKAFGYGECVVIEEFIPGREVRAGCLEESFCPFLSNGVQNGSKSDEKLHVVRCKIEYLMRDKNYPVRREEDKLTYVSNGENSDGVQVSTVSKQNKKMVQVKCERDFLLPNGAPNALSEYSIGKIDEAVRCAHKALKSRDFSLFDFRVHAQTGEPYLIEPCFLWTFSPLSAISLLIAKSDEFISDNEKQGSDWKTVAKKIWINAAERRKFTC